MSLDEVSNMGSREESKTVQKGGEGRGREEREREEGRERDKGRKEREEKLGEKIKGYGISSI